MALTFASVCFLEPQGKTPQTNSTTVGLFSRAVSCMEKMSSANLPRPCCNTPRVGATRSQSVCQLSKRLDLLCVLCLVQGPVVSASKERLVGCASFKFVRLCEYGAPECGHAVILENQRKK